MDLDDERLEVVAGHRDQLSQGSAAARRGEVFQYRAQVKTADGEARVVDLDRLTVDVLKA